MISFFAVLSTNYLLHKLDTLLIHKTTEQHIRAHCTVHVH